MKINGIVKTTFIDYPGKIACTIFTFGCNFKCGFCHNPELVINKINKEYSKEEILKFLKKRQEQLEGICITGGEPLLNIDINFLKKIKELGYLIKLDTNGSFPEKLKELIEKKLIDYVAMDVKTNKANYNKLTNSNIDLKKIEESIKIISTLPNYEFRTTIIEDEHTEEIIKDMAIWINQLTKTKPKNFSLQGFKNNDKFIDKSYETKKDTTEYYLNKLKKTIEKYFEKIQIRT